MSDESFNYLSPWLPMKEGWYRLGHVRGMLHRWRLYQAHERSEASGESWTRWRLFYDVSVVQLDADVASPWKDATELPANIRDRGHASELVEQRFRDLEGTSTDKPAKRAARGKR